VFHRPQNPLVYAEPKVQKFEASEKKNETKLLFMAIPRSFRNSGAVVLGTSFVIDSCTFKF